MATKSKAVLFLDNLENILSSVTTYDIKAFIGDSTQNNRTATIRQVIRFLNATRKTSLASQLQAAYDTELVKEALATNRANTNYRTDGYDINEFIVTFDGFILSDGTSTRLVGQALRAA